jgi:hypothetical protein
MPNPEVLISCLTEYAAEPIHWLWPGRIAAGTFAPDNWDDPDSRQEQANRKEMERSWKRLGNPSSIPRPPHSHADPESPCVTPQPEPDAPARKDAPLAGSVE